MKNLVNHRFNLIGLLGLLVLLGGLLVLHKLNTD